MRNLTKTLAVVSLLAPASAQSLGIGDIKLHSALNQNLNAEIALIVSAGEDVSDIKVSLAPPAKFDEAGVAWSYFLSKIKFEPVVKSNGSVVVKLTSREALKEPFLDFLIQVSWPKGNLFREFTVLVDPPAVYKQPSIPVQNAPETEEAAEPEQAYVPERRPARARSVEARAEEDSVPEPQSSYTPRHRENSAGGNSVTTRKNDTLWHVADRFSKQENVSVEQMMLAIYDKNPHAFFKKNVNALMAGKHLSIPDRQIALKLSRRQALDEFNRQRQAWSSQTAPINPEAVAAASEESDKKLALVAPSDTEVNSNAVVTPGTDKKDQLVNNSGEKTAEIQAIQNKVAELEKQLAVMQQLIALKDQQLATLQNQATTVAAGIKPSDKPAEVKKPASESVAEQSTAAQPEAIAIPTPQPPVVPEVPQAQSQPPLETASKPPVAPTTPVINTTEPAQPKPEAVHPVEAPKIPAESKITPPAKTSKREGVSDSTLDTYYLSVAGLGTVALSLLGWLWWRKRKVEEETDSDSMFASSSVIIVPDADDNVTQTNRNTSFYDVDSLGESSFLSEFTTSDFDVFDTAHGEIDPISEADVYLAYGRYQQAEELIRQAIKDQPNDNECKIKLLEIYYANENKNSFEAYAKELADAGKNFETDFWVKVTDMGKDICPDSSLFAVGAAVAATTSATKPASPTHDDIEKLDSALGYDDLDLDLDMVSFDDPSMDDKDIDTVDLNDESYTQSTIDIIKDKAVEPAKDTNSIEFDLSGFSSKSKKIEPSFENGADADDLETFAFDFDTDTKSKESLSKTKIDIAKAAELDIDTMDLDEDFAASEIAVSTPVTSKEAESFDSDFDFDFNFDFDTSAFGAGTSKTEAESGFEIADLSDMDELETKLDLAKAYVDMGDIGAAKDIANEILSKGSAEQKKSAQLLLNEIS